MGQRRAAPALAFVVVLSFSRGWYSGGADTFPEAETLCILGAGAGNCYAGPGLLAAEQAG